jgi:hypothetical protein
LGDKSSQQPAGIASVIGRMLIAALQAIAAVVLLVAALPYIISTKWGTAATAKVASKLLPGQVSDGASFAAATVEKPDRRSRQRSSPISSMCILYCRFHHDCICLFPHYKVVNCSFLQLHLIELAAMQLPCLNERICITAQILNPASAVSTSDY